MKLSSLRQSIADPYSWVADEPRHTVSKYAGCEDNIPEDMFTDIQNPPLEDWEVRVPNASRRVTLDFRQGVYNEEL
ncbi:hypothetical protein A2U01_0040633, partial [Trifolium medium]|nr:hypothetical protein [Trifolium medium]